MAVLRNILRDVLSDTSRYCCLCFIAIGENETYFNFEDEVSASIEIDATKVLYEMICTVLGYKVLDSISAHNIICQKCTGMVINCYKFIQQCKQNIEQLHCTIDSLQKHIPESVANDDQKALFVALDTSNYNVEFYYEKRKTCNKQTLLHKRFQSLRSQIKKKSPLKRENSQHKEKSPLKKENSQIKKKGPLRREKPGSILQSIVISDISDVVHDKDDLTNLKCKVCSKLYLSALQMKQHYLTVHATKEFKCSKCPKSFESATLLTRHVKYNHSQAICSQCGKRYTSVATLRLHEERHKLEPLICQTCGKIYKDKLSFNNHIAKQMCHKDRKINAEAKLSCSHCGKKYTHRANLNVHIRTEHENGNVVICDWCGKRFSCMSRLQDHIVTHTKHKNFECSQCGGKFVSKMSLLYHTRRHTGETPYECEFCDRTFVSASRRSEHVKRNHVASGVECDICHGRFKGSKSLAQHRKKHFNVKSKLDSEIIENEKSKMK